MPLFIYLFILSDVFIKVYEIFPLVFTWLAGNSSWITWMVMAAHIGLSAVWVGKETHGTLALAWLRGDFFFRQ